MNRVENDLLEYSGSTSSKIPGPDNAESDKADSDCDREDLEDENQIWEMRNGTADRTVQLE